MAPSPDEYSLTTIKRPNNTYTAYVLPTPTTVQTSEDDYTYTGTLVYTDAGYIYLLDPCITRVIKPRACSTYIGMAYGFMSAEAVPELAFTSELASVATLDDLLSPATPAMTSTHNSDLPSRSSMQTISSPVPTTHPVSDVAQDATATSDLTYIHFSITRFTPTPSPTPTPVDNSTRTVIITIPTVICAIILIAIASFFYKRHKRFAGASYSSAAFQTSTPEHHRLEFDSHESYRAGGNSTGAKSMTNAIGSDIADNEASSTHTPQRQSSIFFARPVSYNHILNQQDHQQDHHHELQDTPTHSPGNILPVAAESEIGRAISPPGYEYHRHLTTSIAPHTHDNSRRVASQIIDQELGLLGYGQGQGQEQQYQHHTT